TQGLGDDVLLDLRGAAVDGRDHGRAQVALHRILRRVAVAAHDLETVERAALCKLGGRELRHRGLLRQHAVGLLVGEPGDLADEQARAGQVRGHLRELVLEGLEGADRAAELAPLLRVRERVVERPLGQAERGGGQNDALLVQPGHELGPAGAGLPEQRVLGHAHVIEVQLVGVLTAQRVDRRDGEALGLAGHEDHRHALVLVLGGLGSADNQHVAGLVGERAPHLRAVQHPLAVVADRGGLERSHVRARLRLRHRDRQRAAGGNAAQQVPLLLLGAEAVQRSHADQRDGVGADRRLAAGGLLEEQAGVEEAAVGAAVLLRDAEAVPAQLGHPGGHVVVVRILEPVGELRELLRRALARAEVADRLHEVPLLFADHATGWGSSTLKRFSSRSAITILWTSSGPSAMRSMRPWRHIEATGVSSETPSAPSTWIARSSTSMNTLAATTLIIEISCRAARLPSVSIFQAACSTISRAPWISIRDFATKSWTNCFSASFPPNDSRSLARRHMISKARSAPPIARMQWWMRPGPRRSCAILKPAPRSPSRLSAGTRQSS